MTLGRWLKIRPRDPRARAICDVSNTECMHDDLVPQMAYRGQGLVWTGALVNKRFVDRPNMQEMTPIIPPDPIPVYMARPDTYVEPIKMPGPPDPKTGLDTEIILEPNGVFKPQIPSAPSGPSDEDLGSVYPKDGIYIRGDNF